MTGSPVGAPSRGDHTEAAEPASIWDELGTLGSGNLPDRLIGQLRMAMCLGIAEKIEWVCRRPLGKHADGYWVVSPQAGKKNPPNGSRSAFPRTRLPHHTGVARALLGVLAQQSALTACRQYAEATKAPSRR